MERDGRFCNAYGIHHSRNVIQKQCENEEGNDGFPEVRVSENDRGFRYYDLQGIACRAEGSAWRIRMHAKTSLTRLPESALMMQIRDRIKNWLQ